MNKRNKANAVFIALVAVAVAGLVLLYGGQAQSGTVPAAPAAVEIDAAQVISKVVADTQRYSGRLEAVERVEIRPLVGGTIMAVHFKDGAIVKKGEPLFDIDARPYQAEVDRALAQLAVAEAAARYSSVDAGRASSLIEAKAISRRDYDQTQSNAAATSAGVLAARAALQSARLNLAYAHITAPVAGRMSRAELTEGNVVATGASAPLLATVVSLSPIYAAFEVDEQSYLRYLKPSGLARAPVSKVEVNLGLANESGYSRSGSIDSVDNRLDKQSGTIRVRARFDNSDGSLVPGLYARVQVGGGTARPALLVDDAAIGTDQEKKFVMVIDSTSRAQYRQVDPGQMHDGRRIVEHGLNAGDWIVVNGAQRVRPKDLVKVKAVPMPGGVPAKVGGKTAAAAGRDSGVRRLSGQGDSMNISKFFIDRPIFAGVLSMLILLGGVIAVFKLPISEYPEIIPPQVLVHAQFPGTNPKVIAETVSAPLEESINGVENMLYMQSQSNSDGNTTTTVTFKLGTDPDKAQQLVQNRVSQALPRLPEDVQRLGVTTVKSSATLTMVVHVVSPNGRYDMQYLRNYALLNLRDRLARVRGIGEVTLKGSGDYAMRVWLDPNKTAQRGLAASDVVRSIREQNVQVSAGIVGAQPAAPGVAVQLDVNAKGRLQTEEEFGDIVLKASADGSVTSLRDVARVEMGAADYGQRALINNQQAVAMWIFQQPGANSLQIADDVRAVMAQAASEMPAGVEYQIVYDPTRFVKSSIEAVIHTLLEAIALVVLVVILFLQTWRASIIPLLAVPVSIVGTFSLMLAFGFSINALSLFGMVLAIGIVVDDAIVVVENVERNIASGLSPREATYQAMREVSGPIVAIALTLVAVFVPLAFMSGLTGQFYQQFAMTIAISTVISAFNSLTLSPALAALLLRGHDRAPDRLTRAINSVLGGFFVRFNRLFLRGSTMYGAGVAKLIGRRGAMALLYLVLIGAAVLMNRVVPGGFVPLQDKEYLIAIAQLPNGASLDRTEAVARQIGEIALREPGVEAAVQHPGLSVNGFTSSSSAAIMFITLKSFDERLRAGLTAQKIADSLAARYGAIKGSYIGVFPPPPVLGLGTLGGFKLQIEDRGALGYTALNDATNAFIAAAAKAPELTPVFSTYQINVPQVDVQFDRLKAKQLGVKITDVFDTMQIYLGSAYVNDFNRFGRVYQVRVQADAPFRADASDIGVLQTRNSAGDMVPLSSLLTVAPTYGPEMVVRYNGYTAADINGAAAPGYSSDQAQAAIERIAEQVLPRGFKMEWTDLSYQQKLTGNAALLVFPISVLLVFMVLAAQYESLSLPLAIILIVPVSILAALFGVWLSHGDNNIFTQIGLMVLVGLSAKNAILIVEFARELEMQGRDTVAAAIEASRMRLRPILMTSIAFIMGVLPMVLSSGAGSEMRKAIGITVFSGMLGVTIFGLLLVPVLYVILRRIAGGQPLIDRHGHNPHIHSLDEGLIAPSAAMGERP